MGRAQTEDWSTLKLAINHFVTKASTMRTGLSGTLVIIMKHYALIQDRFLDQWQSNNNTKSCVATLEVALIGLQSGTLRTPREDRGQGDTTLMM
eukprot:1113495-Ditylum_brightwellii.AAC.1